MSKVKVESVGDWVILVSYETPVAAKCLKPGPATTGYNSDKIQTEVKYSATTTRHLRMWGVTPDNRWPKVPQETLDNILKYGQEKKPT